MPTEANKMIANAMNRDGVVTGIDLGGLAFEDLDLEEPKFEQCRASSAIFKGGALNGSVWRNCQLLACQFASVEFREALFDRCRFVHLENRKGSQFRFCDFDCARFLNCDFSLVSFTRCAFFNTTFSKCRLRGAALEAPKFSRSYGRKVVRNAATFDECNLRDVFFDGANLSNCTLRSCDLSEANMARVNLANSDLTGSIMENADLEGADLSGCDLRNARLAGIDLRVLAAYRGLMISASQQHHLLSALGIEVSSG
jgi:fluoroquinolone resistance protein